MTTGTTSGAASARKGRVRALRATMTAEQTRIFLYLVFSMVQRLDAVRRDVYLGDLDLAAVSEAIAVSAVDALMRDAKWRQAYSSVDTVIGAEGQRGINAHSISQATGIPRETTRRKIKKLIELGAIAEAGRGEYVMKPGFLQAVATPQRMEQTMNAALRFLNEALGSELFDLADPQA